MSVSEFKAGLAGLIVLIVVLVAGATAVRVHTLAARGTPCGCLSEDLRFNCASGRRGLV